LPLLRPPITFVVIVSLAYSVTQIDHVATMTNGGPVKATAVILQYIMATAMETQDIGKTSAPTFLTVVSSFFISWINLKIINYEAIFFRETPSLFWTCLPAVMITIHAGTDRSRKGVILKPWHVMWPTFLIVR
jgi:hypothetical protein